jgi:PncC family amidohydrolase
MENSERLVSLLSSAEKKIVLAESCTAGLIADIIAKTPGASKVLWGSFVCYTVSAKNIMLGIPENLIAHYGAVSRETACAMAESALEKSDADIALSVTGLAGPDGDGTDTPVGTVWIAIALKGKEIFAKRFRFVGNRNEIRMSAVNIAVKELLNLFL